MIHTYWEQTGKIFAENFRIGVWLSNAPESTLKTHLRMRTELVRWAGFRTEMNSCTRALKASSGSAPSPMDIGAFAKGKKGDCKGENGDGKGKQRSKDAATCSKRGKTGTSAGQCLSDRTCSKCGKKGHRAEKCLSKSSSAPGTGSSLSNSKSELCLWQGWTLFGGLPNKRTKALAAIEDADPPTVSALSLSLAGSLRVVHDRVC